MLFEAMHTGHAVYATLHADRGEQVKNRLTNPPINLPESLVGAVHLIIVQYRQRRTGIRRTFEISEVIPTDTGVKLNKVYQWNPKTDKLDKVGEYIRITDELFLHGGLTKKDLADDLDEKKKVLQYLINNKIFDLDDVGRVIAKYYRNKDALMEEIK